MVDFSSFLTAAAHSGNSNPANNFLSDMDDQSNSQRAMQIGNQHLQIGGAEQQLMNGIGGYGSNTLSTSLLQQHQLSMDQLNQLSSDSYNFNYNGGMNNDSSNANNNALNISNEIKRLQHLHQLGAGGAAPSNALLMNPGSSDNSTSIFWQSMLAADSQQKANLAAAANNRFENPLSGAHNMISSNTNMMPVNAQLNPPGTIANMQLPSNFLNDARLLMAQNQLFQQGVNFSMIQQPQIQQQQHQQQQGAVGMGSGTTNPELPLPSPHSLFHRDGSRRMRGGVIEPFPEKLHRLLMEVEAAGRSNVISFVASGRAFLIHMPDKFFKDIVPLYFRQSRLSSFKRQLNLYGFELINTGPARGGYYHELFVKDQPELCRRMRRVAVKVGSEAKKIAHAKSEQDDDKADEISSDNHPEHDEECHI